MVFKKSALAALAVAALSSSTSAPTALAASPSLSVQALQEGKIYYAKDVPELKLSKAPAKAGTLDCRSKRTIPTWNNEEVVVCDAALCKGAEDSKAPPRFSDAQLSRYMKALGEFLVWLVGSAKEKRESRVERAKTPRDNGTREQLSLFIKRNVFLFLLSYLSPQASTPRSTAG